MLFEIGKEYRRASDLHGRYGGSWQNGITRSTQTPIVFLFTGKSGERYGYEDRWDAEGVFLYTGEGQVGDMTFKGGNRAVRDHAAEGRDLHLFETRGKGRPVRYTGQFVCAGWHQGQGPDRNGALRKTIVFHLVPLSDFEEPAHTADEAHRDAGTSLAELRKRALEAGQSAPRVGAGEGRRNIYQRSREVRAYVLARANGICECCSQPAPFKRSAGEPYLEPHHIRRLSDGGPDHPAHVAAICPNCHREVHFGARGPEKNQKLGEAILEMETRNEGSD